jgi:hypothetical protein
MNSAARRPVRDRYEFTTCPRSRAIARRRAPGTTARRAARLSLRAQPARAFLDRFIAPLRDLAPLVAGRLEQKTQPLEAIAANNVVDGQSLHGKWRDDQASVIARLQQAGAGTAELATLKLELNALGDAIDGLSDALTAEVAYQLARGNTSRIASTLAAVARRTRAGLGSLECRAAWIADASRAGDVQRGTSSYTRLG